MPVATSPPTPVAARTRARRILRVLGWLFVLLAAVALLLGLLAAWQWRQSLPALAGTREAPGLARAVRVEFDRWQRPTVRAERLEDAFYAQGYLHASERAWQMELLRRAGRGRLAEMLGSPMLPTDEELWRIGVPQLADQLMANATPQVLEWLQHYVAGVNAGLAALPAKPPEFTLLALPLPTWEPRDVFGLGAVMAVESARNWRNEALRLALSRTLTPEELAAFTPPEAEDPAYPYVLPRATRPAGPTASPAAAAKTSGVLPARSRGPWRLAAEDPLEHPLMPRAALGSNAWAVAPARSGSGKALFAFDSHDALGVPNLFYEVHLIAGGRQIRGWSVPGLPGVVNGYNERIAWGFTNIGDTQDLFLETRHPSDPLRFKLGSEWLAARVQRVQIPVRLRSEPHVLDIVHTTHGPLVQDDPPLALAWSAHRIGDLGLDALFQVNLARNWAEFDAALSRLAAPALNATYADVDGHIGFRTVGLYPQRAQGVGLMPLDGADPLTAWRGIVPQDQLPRIVDPPAGYVAAANARVNAPGQGPLISADNASPYRIARLQQVLGGTATLRAEDMRALQRDWHDMQAVMLLPAMLRELRAAGAADAREQAAIAALEAWLAKPVAAPDSAAALVFQSWYAVLADAVFSPRLTPDLRRRLLRNNYLVNQALDRLILEPPTSPWWRGQRPQILREALATALGRLAEQQGPDLMTWRLERAQKVPLRHELSKAIAPLSALFDAPPRAWGGGPSTVGRASYRYERPFVVTDGATVRTVIEMSGVPRAASVMPGGQSGHPASPHAMDQFDAWLSGELLPIDGATAGLSVLTLQPGATLTQRTP